MATTPEGKVKAKVKDYLRAIGAWFFMPVAGPFAIAGIPDFIGCHEGRFFAIETKALGLKDNVTLHQSRIMALIRGAGGLAFVADCVEDVKLAFVAWRFHRT